MGQNTPTIQFAGQILEHITVANGILYGTAGHELSATRLSDGKQLWSTTTNSANQIITGPSVANGVVYTTILNITSDSGNGPQSVVAAFKADNGAKLWQSEPISGGPFGITLVNNVIYAGTADGTLYAYDAQQGKCLWSHTTTGSIQSSPVVADGVVYIVEDTGVSLSDAQGCRQALNVGQARAARSLAKEEKRN